MLAFGRNDDNPRFRAGFDLAEHIDHFLPKRQGHGIVFLGPVKTDMGHIVGDIERQGRIGHQLPLSGNKRFVTLPYLPTTRKGCRGVSYMP